MQVDIAITAAAAQRLGELSAQSGGKPIRLSVKAAGCSGLEYVMEVADGPANDDLILAGEGFHLCIDRPSYEKALKGLKIDFQKDLLSSAFVYLNPNSKGVCGCGASFAV